MKYYVYVYLNPLIKGDFTCFEYKFEHEPFYVGKGHDDRCYYHITNNNKIKKSNTPFYNKINKLREDGILPEIKILKYFENELDAYQYETELIKEIGSNYIDEIKNGSLKNLCLYSQPPNYKGKTYFDIYGDRAEEQRKLRHIKQLEVGGFFKGHKHSDESKRKIGLATTKIHTGMKRSEETKLNISKSKIGKCAGNKNPNSRKYKIVSPTNETYIIHGEFKKFCASHNLSASTLSNTLKSNKRVKSGKTKDWQAFILPN